MTCSFEMPQQGVWDGRTLLPGELAAHVLPLIRRQARALAQRLPPHVAVDDLVSAGTVALAELLKKHPTMTLVEFERLATSRARYAMLDELRAADPVSRRLRQRARRVGQATTDLQSRLGRKPSDDEVAVSLGLSVESCRAALALAHSSATTSIDGESGFDLADDSTNPEEELGRTERADILRDAVSELPVRQRNILELYFREELTLRQIGGRLGVTEARVSQILGEAVRKLRQQCSLQTLH